MGPQARLVNQLAFAGWTHHQSFCRRYQKYTTAPSISKANNVSIRCIWLCHSAFLAIKPTCAMDDEENPIAAKTLKNPARFFIRSSFLLPLSYSGRQSVYLSSNLHKIWWNSPQNLPKIRWGLTRKIRLRRTPTCPRTDWRKKSAMTHHGRFVIDRLGRNWYPIGTPYSPILYCFWMIIIPSPNHFVTIFVTNIEDS